MIFKHCAPIRILDFLSLQFFFSILNFMFTDGLTFDRKRHLIGEEFFKQETKEEEEISAENLTRIQTIVSSGNNI